MPLTIQLGKEALLFDDEDEVWVGSCEEEAVSLLLLFQEVVVVAASPFQLFVLAAAARRLSSLIWMSEARPTSMGVSYAIAAAEPDPAPPAAPVGALVRFRLEEEEASKEEGPEKRLK